MFLYVILLSGLKDLESNLDPDGKPSKESKPYINEFLFIIEIIPRDQPAATPHSTIQPFLGATLRKC
jgi:hypothetical protein